MCGIFGIVKSKKGRISDKEMNLMHRAQIHRGPDHFGFFNQDNVFLGNNRLSIIDLDHGNQPFYSEDQKIIVLQNGEIFNYVELQAELRSRGINFKTGSDTEVILKLYEEYGISMIRKLNGMFAIVILDLRSNNLFLIRDRFGQKPLFYFKNKEQFIFSSEIKSILELRVQTELNKTALHTYLKYNFVAGKETIFKNIYNINPGKFIKLDILNNDFQEYSWWFPNDEIGKYIDLVSQSNQLELIKETVFDSIKIRMRSDVEYSAFLSGGIDSSIIVSQMNKVTDSKFNTFTIGFGDSKFDESRFANEVAKSMNVNHRCENISDNILSYWDEVLKFTEQPHGDVSFIPMYLLSQFASEKDRVVLTGDGADEIYGGYDKYNYFDEKSNFEKQFNDTSILFTDSEIYKLLGEYVNQEANIVGEITQNDPVMTSGILETKKNMAMYLDAIFLLPYNNLIKPDRMGMAHSVELRSPFMDYRSVSLAFALKAEDKLKNNTSKYLLRETFKHDIPSTVFNRKKQKFIVPLEEDKRVVKFFYNSIKSSELIRTGLVHDNYVDNLYLLHSKGTINNYRKLRALAALVKWYNLYAKYI